MLVHMTFDCGALARAYWDTIEARDWGAFGELLADDVVYECPQTRERVRGREAYVRFNREFPGDWHVQIVQIVANEGRAVTWTSFKMDDGLDTGIAFLDFDPAGKIVKITDFWPEPYEPPTNRVHLVERY
jgi:ketosteroid isomerase-like protein